MTGRERQFLILFNALWYKDFPIIRDFLGFGTRAGWTLHIGAAVREAANLMGLFMTFETGGRTDGEIHMFDNTRLGERKTWAKVEWEWNQATHPNINEFEKLRTAASEGQCEVAIFFGRYKTSKLPELLEIIKNHWQNSNKPLLCFLLEGTGFSAVETPQGRKRRPKFGALSTYRFAPNRQGGISVRRLRRQPAYPWEVEGTKWAARRTDQVKEVSTDEDSE
jgi:hypothetical protein